MNRSHSFEYLGGKKWANITREERYFCCELYNDIKADAGKFVAFLNQKFKKEFKEELNEKLYWEVGFEVCFYRDLRYSQGLGIKNSKYPPKRTFDLCLFSERDLIIIEAKADQNFDKNQLNDLHKDQEKVLDILNKSKNELNVLTILLCSSGNKQDKLLQKEKVFYWDDLFKIYGEKYYLKRANELMRKGYKK